MTTCARCLVTDAVPFVTFDDDGLCSYCRDYPELEARFFDATALAARFTERIEEIRGRYPYDALLGLSGGKDSTYVLKQLVEVHRLNVLTFTIDNGFLTEPARRNIAGIVAHFGVDHFFYEPPGELLAALYRMALDVVGTPCAACFIGGYALTARLAADRDIPLAIHGRSRPQMFRFYTRHSLDPTLPMALRNVEPWSRDLVLEGYRQAVGSLLAFSLTTSAIRRGLTPEVAGQARIVAPPIEKLERMVHPTEFVGYFVYHPYDEEAVVRAIDGVGGWRRGTQELLGHFDCAAHDGAMWLHHRRVGYSFVAGELSYLIRSGALTRDEALARLLRESDAGPPPTDSLDTIADVAGVDLDDLLV